MTDPKPTRREILRPLHLVGIALACGIFAMIVTLVSTGAFTERVNLSIAKGTYEGMTPLALSLVVGGGAFIVTLLGLAMLMLAVDPADVTKRVDRAVLLGPDDKTSAVSSADVATGSAEDASPEDGGSTASEHPPASA